MPGPAGGRDEELLEKHRRGTLSAGEARELARRSLENEELAEALMVDGLIEEGLSDPAFRARWLPATTGTQPGYWRWLVAAAALSAAILAFWIYRPVPPPGIASSQPSKSVPRPIPSLNPDSGQPVLLAGRFRGADSVAFRGEAGASRLPYQSRAVTAVADEEITFGLGSLDGLAHGARVTIRRKGREVALVEVTAVFRERCRGRVVGGGPVETGDEARMDPAAHFAALWTRVDALVRAGDVAAARRLALSAQRFSESNGISPKPEIWEALGVLHLLAGDTADALRSLEKAIAAGPRASALNNLAVQMEMKGDAAGALRLYEQALDAQPSPSDRQRIERNLVRLRKAP